MDPVTLIVSALAAGAAAGLKDTAESVVKDAYRSLTGLLSRRYGRVDLEPLEREPESEDKRGSVARQLAEVGAGKDTELFEQARQLVEAVREYDPQAGMAIGVDLADIEADFIRLGKITSTGIGFRGERIKVQGGIEVDEVDAGGRSGTEDP